MKDYNMSDEKEILDGNLRARVNAKELNIFSAKCERLTGRSYQVVLREMITSFNNGDLHMKPTEEYHKGELYKV